MRQILVINIESLIFDQQKLTRLARNKDFDTPPMNLWANEFMEGPNPTHIPKTHLPNHHWRVKTGSELRILIFQPPSRSHSESFHLAKMADEANRAVSPLFLSISFDFQLYLARFYLPEQSNFYRRSWRFKAAWLSLLRNWSRFFLSILFFN